MLKVAIVLRPQRAEVVCQKLVAAGWAEELIAWECRGYGRQKEHLEQYGGHEGSIEFLPKVTIECLIEDERREELVQLVLATCRTGRIGDGKIFFLPIATQVDVAGA
ncbi:MAG: P-II family nitrogen regulator [Planctomycetota bacterium]